MRLGLVAEASARYRKISFMTDGREREARGPANSGLFLYMLLPHAVLRCVAVPDQM